MEEAFSIIDSISNADKPRIGSRKIAQLPAPSLEIKYEVRKELHRFLKRQPAYIPSILKKGAKNVQIIKKVLADEGLPEELMSVALIESGFNQNAKSTAGASGLWQFMEGTGSIYGLQVGYNKDQRNDPILSSVAAARHLKDLYTRYNDWYLALAAYNAGMGRVDRAITEGKTKNFWELKNKGLLPEETRNYVPKFIAAALVIKNLDKLHVKNGRIILTDSTDFALVRNL